MKLEFLLSAKEGYLFPDTYLLNLDYTGEDVAKRMESQFNEKTAELLEEAVAKNIRNDTLVVLASLVQREAANEEEMPIDNPVKLWDETKSPFQRVAKITIRKQTFESAAQEQFCEDLSITPWHTISEHQPLGTIELTRKAVYQATSELRHQLNGRPRTEPTGREVFEQR